MPEYNQNNITDVEIIDLTPQNIADYGVCGYKDVKKHLELRRKINWFEKYYLKGLKIKIVLSKKGGYQGMLEYIPGKYAHRPVDAQGYMFIHCIFVGFKNEFKGKGYASCLIDKCIEDTKNAGMNGVAVVTREGSFMSKKDIFIKKGFTLVDKSEPDFELLVLKFNQNTVNPKFIKIPLEKHNDNDILTIMRSAQCPYSVKNIDAILETAKRLNIKTNLVELNDSESCQQTPSAFGTFCIIYKGEIISHHPISNTRFENIMKKKIV